MDVIPAPQTGRYRATGLGKVLEEQGRKRRWLARRVGISEPYLSRIIAGDKTIDRARGERIGALLGVPFFLLFEFADR
jgi:hypothetical protein